MKLETNEQAKTLIRKIINMAIAEFLLTMVFIIGVELANSYWGHNLYTTISGFKLEWIYVFKAFIFSTILAQFTITFIEYRETRSALFNPEKDLNLTIRISQRILLQISILPLGYVVATYTMMDKSVLFFIIFVAAVYIICGARVTLAFATHFYQLMLLDYYKKHEPKKDY